MKTFDRALGFSLALHVAVLALWQWSDARPTEPKPYQVSTPMAVSLALPQSEPQSWAVPAPPWSSTQRPIPTTARVTADLVHTSAAVTTAVAATALVPMQAAAAPALSTTSATAEAAQVSPTLVAVTETVVPTEPDTSSASDPIPSSALGPLYLLVGSAYAVRASTEGGNGEGASNAVAATSSTQGTPVFTSTQKSATVEWPSSDPDYRHNPKPAYPAMSRRLGEQGKVLVRVLIDPNGQPQHAEIKQSSGFQRLDQAALNTVLKWRYLPGQRNGSIEAIWLQVPLEFRLE